MALLILSRILVWLVSLRLVLIIGIWIHFPFAFILKVHFSASSSITPSIPRFPGSTRFLDAKSFISKTVLEGNLHQVPSHHTFRNAVYLLIKEIDTWIMELRTYAIKLRTKILFPERQLYSWLSTVPYLTFYTDKIWPQLLYGDHGICQSRPEGTLCA